MLTKINPLLFSKLSSRLLIIVAAAFIALYIIIALLRINYPFELEWMEGGTVDHISRVLEGQKLYGEPTLEFVPYAYPPVFTLLSAGFAKILGLGFMPLRLVSFLASIGSFLVIFTLVKRETGGNFAGILAAGLFAATFKIAGAWFDIARVDSLFVFILLVAIYLCRYADTRSKATLAGLVFSMAFLTKQIALVFAVPVALYFLLRNRKLAPYFVGILILVIGGSTLLLDLTHDGWYSFYIFSFHAGRSINPDTLLLYLRSDLVELDMAGFVAIFFLLSRFAWRKNTRQGLFYLLLSGGIIAGCGISRSLSLGAGTNVEIPAYAIIAVLFGLGAHEILRCVQKAAASDAKWGYLTVFFLAICLLQFSRLAYNPIWHIPNSQDLQAGEDFIRKIERIDGEVFMPGHGYLSRMAGKKTYVHLVGILDSMSNEKTRPYIKAAILDGIRQRRFQSIILDFDWEPLLPELDAVINEHYQFQGRVFESRDAFITVTGVKTRPEKIYVPKDSS